mmetsp:Transcript_31449/g.60633  ORF Transcript_31449/g.60633 Transcript_31449/m.60633 type:complete len:116 (-) Transcript_31449:300-647(-)|eukprot:CAMPEP_0114226750 /NCGR_PEP_ID=MMETSP0058-20121206/1404_1 /TAXON_ID=36894 /ORGANISM="Pyramimonas parkeae, CCMP726" /LENGTH=115 /DNA_ID=CAMNT_0001337507 /DNA_START=673 /DNA_END=1020 /DNA_ORIENTATION=+
MGVECVIEKAGDGRHYAKKGEVVSIHYTLKLRNEDGKLIDTTYGRDAPFTFKVGSGQVVRGWDEVVTQLSVGERARCTIPADLAYGAKGFPGLIPPNTSMYVELELLSITTPDLE